MEHDAGPLELAYRFQQMNHGCRIGFSELLVALANDELRGHVNDDFGITLGDRRLQTYKIPHGSASAAPSLRLLPLCLHNVLQIGVFRRSSVLDRRRGLHEI
jgi:hypothetical protein